MCCFVRGHNLNEICMWSLQPGPWPWGPSLGRWGPVHVITAAGQLSGVNSVPRVLVQVLAKKNWRRIIIQADFDLFGQHFACSCWPGPCQAVVSCKGALMAIKFRYQADQGSIPAPRTLTPCIALNVSLDAFHSTA
jgi:hypothetical protein